MAQKDTAFAILDAPKALKGITSADIAELYDIAQKFGAEYGPGGRVRRLSVSGDPPLYVSAQLIEPRHIFVSTIAGHLVASADHTVVFGTQEKNSALMVDPKVSLADLRALVAKVDKLYADFRHPQTGERMRISSDTTASAKLCVADLLRAFPDGVTFSAGTTPEQAAAILDDPDAVAFVKDEALPCGFRMVDKTKAVRTDLFDTIMAELLHKYGIDSDEAFAALTDDQKKAFHQELLDGIESRQKEVAAAKAPASEPPKE